MSAPDADPPRRAEDRAEPEPAGAIAASAAAAEAGGDESLRRGYARSRARTEAIQAQLKPLGPDERPLGIKLATALAVFLAAANLVGAAAGVGGQAPSVGVAFAVLLLMLAAGVWSRRYLVILLFEALLALTIVIFALSLALASNLLAVVLAVVAIAVCSPIFWLLVRVMARLQVPPE